MHARLSNENYYNQAQRLKTRFAAGNIKNELMYTVKMCEVNRNL